MSYQVEVNVELLVGDVDMASDLIEKLLSLDHTFEYDLVYDVSIGRPAKIDGPPEKCYPAEGDEYEYVGDSFETACELLEPVKDQLTVKEICRAISAISRHIDNTWSHERYVEQALEKAHELNSEGPDCDYQREDD